MLSIFDRTRRTEILCMRFSIMGFKQIPRIPVGASAKRSGARITTSCTPPILGFKQIPRIPVGADLSCTPPIYRPLPAVPLSRLIYETSLSAFPGRSALSLHLVNRVTRPCVLVLCGGGWLAWHRIWQQHVFQVSRYSSVVMRTSTTLESTQHQNETRSSM